MGFPDLFKFLNPLRPVSGVLEKLVDSWGKLVGIQINRKREDQKIEDKRKDNDVERVHRENICRIEEKEAEFELFKKKMYFKVEMLKKLENLPLIQMDEQRKADVTDSFVNELLELPYDEKTELLPPQLQTKVKGIEEGE